MTRVAVFTLADDGGGPGQYERSVVAALQGLAPDLTVHRVRTRSLRSTLPGEVRLPLNRATRWPAWAQYAACASVLRGYDLVHRCDLRLPAARREVLTVHDTAWLHNGDAPTPSPRSLESVREAVAVIAPSRFAADEIANHLGRADVVVVPNGVEDTVRTALPLGDHELRGLGLDRPYLLCAGGNAERKNLPALLDAWSRVRPSDRLLAITGVGSQAAVVDGVVPMGFVPRKIFLGLLAGCDGVVVPSTYEGFGLPALEGMAAGKPVLATKCASLPEVCGDAALLCDPSSAGLAEGLRTLLTDETVRTALSFAGPGHSARFTWGESARGHLAVYRAALSSG